MCGIYGYIGNSFNLVAFQDGLRTIERRGPDDTSSMVNKSFGETVALGHTRLAIVGLGPAGNQPLKYKNLFIVFNGEIYNFMELREELAAGGVSFSTNTDTEVILKGFYCQGVEFFKKVRGMYAFAIYNSFSHKLILGRDPAGKKPLYLALGKELVFGSELKAVLKLVRPEKISESALADYMRYGYVRAPKSIYQGIETLRPGMIIQVDLVSRRKKGLTHISLKSNVSIPETYEAFLVKSRELLIKSVEARLYAERPMGIFLSGGIDSSLISAIAIKECGIKLNSYSVGFKEVNFDESGYAKAVARELGLKHKNYVLSEREAIDVLEDCQQVFDEPFADTSIIPLAFLAKKAREEVQVALTGDGGDEIFAGYSKYAFFHNLNSKRFLVGGRWGKVAQVASPTLVYLNELLPKKSKISNLESRLGKLVNSLNSTTLGEAFLQASSNYFFEETKSLLHDSEKVESLQNAVFWDQDNQLPNGFLVKSDRCSMMHGLELRAPLLDLDLARFVNSAPIEWKFRKGRLKAPLREMLEAYLPKKLFERPKSGFTVPYKTVLREANAADLTHVKSSSANFPFLEKAKVNSIIKNAEKGKDQDIQKLWCLLQLKRWERRWGLNEHE